MRRKSGLLNMTCTRYTGRIQHLMPLRREHLRLLRTWRSLPRINGVVPILSVIGDTNFNGNFLEV